MQTAVNRIAASNSSCPMPATADAISPVNAATSAAPATPAAIPSATVRPRRGTPTVAARTMLTINAASRTSRNTMTATASMGGPALNANAKRSQYIGLTTLAQAAIGAQTRFRGLAGICRRPTASTRIEPELYNALSQNQDRLHARMRKDSAVHFFDPW